MEDDLIGDIENYYGIKQNSYNIILVPMFHPGGFASRLENKDGSFDIYSIQARWAQMETFLYLGLPGVSGTWYITSSAIPL